MTDVLKVNDQYYVLATSVLADRETRVLKQGETFAIFDRYGDIQPMRHSEAGVFHLGTRFLSLQTLRIGSTELSPVLLNSTLRDDNGVLKVEMTNPDLALGDNDFLAKGSVHIHREKFLLDGACFEKVTFTNFTDKHFILPISIRVHADFADTFEVRGMRRSNRGEVFPIARMGRNTILNYRGLDHISRQTAIMVHDVDFKLEGEAIQIRVEIPPRGTTSFHLDMHFHAENKTTDRYSHQDGLSQIMRDHTSGRHKYCGIRTSNEQFDTWLRRSTDDLVMMTTPTQYGFEYPYAGIPWFAAAFGRDGIITAMECLWANPSMAKGVLGFLAATQAKTTEPERDSSPGKIIHEIRHGEMAKLGEIPFGQYYGSIDSTPLFLALCGRYYRRTNDVDFLRSIWPSVLLALEWMQGAGDPDHDGFLEYQAQTPRGLAQQGWKDSHDSVFHEDGSDAFGPIALCEVQAYAHMAYSELAPLALRLGEEALAESLNQKANKLYENFNQAFWIEGIGAYALALDGKKNPCRVLSSNAGQCLLSGIVPHERAARIVQSLMQPNSFCGWGIRTIDAKSARYNPMSYHNGSVWPHDNAMIAAGFSRYGFTDAAERIFEGQFRASQYMELTRMPEVFCGFERRIGEAPTLYHHACAPQAWAAGTIYQFIQAALGLSVDAVDKQVQFFKPRLPVFIESLQIKHLQVGNAGHVDLLLQNYGSDVSVQILNRDQGITVAMEK